MTNPSNLKPGERSPASGQYVEIGPRGGKHHEITSIKGAPLPPTQMPGATYKLVDPSKNKSGKTK
jgi:hypothetical protein